MPPAKLPATAAAPPATVHARAGQDERHVHSGQHHDAGHEYEVQPEVMGLDNIEHGFADWQNQGCRDADLVGRSVTAHEGMMNHIT